MKVLTKPSDKDQATRGFSLLEILVAFSIMALCLGVLLRIFAGSGLMSSTADDYSRAVIAAQSLMDSLGTERPLHMGESRGELGEGLRWSLKVQPYAIDPSLLNPSQPLELQLVWVDLDIEWGALEDPRAFALRTLKLISVNQGGGQ